MGQLVAGRDEGRCLEAGSDAEGKSPFVEELDSEKIEPAARRSHEQQNILKLAQQKSTLAFYMHIEFSQPP